MPRGTEIASFATYPEAQHAVDSLSDDGFPVQHLAIIGTDLRQVEHITGRRSWGRTIAAGAGSGLWIGIFFAAMMMLFSPSANGGVTMGAAVFMGVVWGIFFQVVSYALTRGKRDFTSYSQVVASRYSILASAHVSEAAQALAAAPGNLTPGGEAARRAEERRAARAEARGGEPTAFGSRPDERPRFGVRLPEGEDPARYTAGGGSPQDSVDSGSPGGHADDGAGAPGATGPAAGAGAPSSDDRPDAEGSMTLSRDE